MDTLRREIGCVTSRNEGVGLPYLIWIQEVAGSSPVLTTNKNIKKKVKKGGGVAQLAERKPEELGVGGSIPPTSTKNKTLL